MKKVIFSALIVLACGGLSACKDGTFSYGPCIGTFPSLGLNCN